MKFGIVGAGAMGSLIGSFLARAKEDVRLVDVWEDHVSQINQDGLTVVIAGNSETVPIHATTNTKDVGICDVVIIFTKYRHTRAAIQSARCMINDETVVMTVQNGIGNVEIISEYVNEEQIVFGTTLLGSIIKGPGRIEASSADLDGPVHIWPLVGEPGDKVRDMVDAFNQAGLNFQLSSDTRERIWKKICLNASSATVRAITGLKSCEFINQDSSPELKHSYLELIWNLILEIVAIANKEGVTLNAETEYDRIINIVKHNPNHRPSFLVDVLNQRKTEIDSFNGAIVAKAKEHSLEVPYHNTIYNLTKIIENTYDQNTQHL